MRRLLIITLIFCGACSNSFKEQHQLESAKYEKPQLKPSVLLLGTFHFEGELVDNYQPQEKFEVNMLLPERQVQIEEVLTQLEKYKPTIVCIEAKAKSQRIYDSLYSDYLQEGNTNNQISERITIGFELAKRTGLRRIYCIDTEPYKTYLSKDDSATFLKYADQPDNVIDYWSQQQERHYNYDDSLIYAMPLKDYLLYANSDSVNKKEMGFFLVSTRRGTNEDPVGADGWITKYYNRNIRIYSNVQRLNPKPNDRILIIYGATHLYILKHLFEASPEFELVSLDRYLN